MAGGAGLIWFAVVALAAFAIRARLAGPAERRATRLIIGGGVVAPTIVLAALLVYGLSLLPGMLAPAPPGSLRIAIVGEQWWWRIRYHPAAGEAVDLANEIRLPVNEPVEFELSSPDVIHSFWIPALGGKMDMIPGRKNRLTLHPTRTGVFRGVCAEFCGTSHAWMAFDVIVLTKPEFERWLEAQRAPAAERREGDALRGRAHFLANGCGACHAVRGFEARGTVGPDLTHVGSRRTLGAGVVPNTHAGFVRWLARTNEIKPGVLMPHFGMLPEEEVNALAAFLESLR